jgi:hypothetical protein
MTVKTELERGRNDPASGNSQTSAYGRPAPHPGQNRTRYLPEIIQSRRLKLVFTPTGTLSDLRGYSGHAGTPRWWIH